MNDLEMAAKFREAAAGVRVGWNQYSHPARLEQGGHCALGWLAAVTHFNEEDLSRLADERLGHPLPWWNDAPERSKEDVVALFEGLAHDLELRHQIYALPAETGKTLATNRQLVEAVHA